MKKKKLLAIVAVGIVAAGLITVGSGWSNPPSGNRRIHYSSGYHIVESVAIEETPKRLASRSLAFVKLWRTSDLRITYRDVVANSSQLTVEAKLDGQPLPTPLVLQNQASPPGNTQLGLMGYAQGIVEGQHVLEIEVVSTDENIVVGEQSTFLLEVQEIP